MRAGRHDIAPSVSRERSDARLDQRREHDGERGLDPEHAGRRFLEGHRLRLGRMGGVVGRDRVDRAVDERGPQCVDVGLLTQRRVHLEHRVERRARCVGENEMLRRALGGDAHPVGLGRSHRARPIARSTCAGRGNGRR